jgi:hypothetical protein
MNSARFLCSPRFVSVFYLSIVTAAVTACRPELTVPVDKSAVDVRAAKAAATTDMTVSAATPDSATQDTTLDVTISGSGFVAGTAAAWSLGGVQDPLQVRTNSTRFINSRQLVANITISGSAAVAKWDVVVTAAGKKGGIGSEAFAIKSKVVDPTATWKIPLADAGLALRSDHASGDGFYSVYANGVCNVSGQIFATAATSSGDGTLQTSAAAKGKCGRTISLFYPDGFSETLATFANLNDLDNTVFSIPIGTTVMRRLVINPGVVMVHPTRCGKLLFGVGPLGEQGIGTDSVLVTRIDASSWHVQSRTAPNDRALCVNNGVIYEMPLSFVIVASYPLP